ncbi:protein of unknown function DUF35 [halophilic archaeon DL31]|jgi:hydroxymethylglutaryl-CoA synthase|nr:protein of unknown function DUF35 [halophilic archaeon DL31]
MTGPSITGAGIYTPRYRIDAATIADALGRFQAAGISEKRVAAADEDALTMGTAAARRALEAAEVEPGAVETLAFASTTPPLAEEELTPKLAAFLGIDATVHRSFGAATRAGTQAIATAADTESFPALVVTSDNPQGEPNSAVEHAAGAGAVAFVIEGTPSGATLVDRAEYAADYPGTRFREQGDTAVHGLGITSYDRQAFRECVRGAVSQLEIASEPTALALQAPDGKLPARTARALDMGSELITVASDCGDLGAASAPAALARAFENESGTTLTVGFGSGAGADALLFDGAAPVVSNADRETKPLDYPQYLRLRGELDSTPPAGGGAQVSVPSWRRQREARYRLVAGRCPNCSAIAFPAEGACPDCLELVTYDDVRLSHMGTVETVTGVSPGGAPPEFAAQAERGGDFGVAIVSFPAREGDGDASAPVQVTDADPGSVDSGDAVKVSVRRIYTQEGVTRYGRKVKPAK